MNARLAAVYILSRVIEGGKSLTESFSECFSKHAVQGESLAKELCFGVLRFYPSLSFLADQLLSKKMKSKDSDIYLLILVGLYQLRSMKIAEYAVVKETVAVASLLKKVWAKNVVNAVLRNYQRNKITLEAALLDSDATLNHAHWMIEKIKKQWPADWQAIMMANNQQPELVLRVNVKKISRIDYLEKLSALGLTAVPHPWAEQAVIVNTHIDVTSLPGFDEGLVSVQDASAQMAASLMKMEDGLRVLDACAAPGGKTTHLLEQVEHVEVWAIDKDDSRMERVRENLLRTKLSAKCISADVKELTQWWDGKLFDRILLDAPCTASGVIRRHPDIKWLRHESDLIQTVESQGSILSSLWGILKKDGILVYCTCSIFKEENEFLISKFISEHEDCVEEKIISDWGKSVSVGKQLLPSENNDGFYFAVLRKNF